jgi:hypothetical protein
VPLSSSVGIINITDNVGGKTSRDKITSTAAASNSNFKRPRHLRGKLQRQLIRSSLVSLPINDIDSIHDIRVGHTALQHISNRLSSLSVSDIALRVWASAAVQRA